MVALRTKATQVNPFRLIGRPIRPYSLRATQSVAPFLFAAPFVILNRSAVASSLPYSSSGIHSISSVKIMIIIITCIVFSNNLWLIKV